MYCFSIFKAVEMPTFIKNRDKNGKNGKSLFLTLPDIPEVMIANEGK